MKSFRNGGIGYVLKRNVLRLCCSFAILASLASLARCCSIPVFRYALEHWSPEPYVVRVTSPTRWNQSQFALLQNLEELGKNANIRLVLSEGQNVIGQVHDSAWLSVQMPKAVEAVSSVGWDGPLTEETIHRLLSSPVRKKICQGLVNQDSVAWIFLESGDPAVDDAKFSMLESELRRLERIIKLLPIDAADLKDLSTSPGELKIQFSAHRVSRNDPAEAAFVSMLLATESDLREEFENGSPMAFPVFGRGRVLYALLGDGIATSTIEEACRFLAGACQCTVKADNPGVDILVSFDWAEHVQITSPKKGSEMPLTGLGPVGKWQSDSTSVDLGASLNASKSIDGNAVSVDLTPPPGLAEVEAIQSFSRTENPNYDLRPRVGMMWMTLGVLAAFVGALTVGWMFLFSPKV